MDAVDQVAATGEFFETPEGITSISKALAKGKDHVIVDFNDLSIYNMDLAQDLLDDPENVLQAMSHALGNNPSGLPNNCVVRVKNASKTTIKKIHNLRKKHEGLFVTVEGFVKQKSKVRGLVVLITYKCNMCGNLIQELQLDEHKIKIPGVCPHCAAKSRFTIAKEEKVDLFSMMVEEMPSADASNNKLDSVKILARGGLANSSVERMIFQGAKIKVTGIMKNKRMIINGKTSNLIDWYIEANYVEVLEENLDSLNWTAKEEKQFVELSKRRDVIDVFSKHIFPEIYGYEKEKTGIILSLFSGKNYLNQEGGDIRGISHVLLVGDPGTAKSSMLSSLNRFVPKSRYVAGIGISAVGLTGAAVKDELLGGWTIEAGALPLTSGGYLLIDELDKVSEDNKKALHEPMEQLKVSIDKGGAHATLPAETTIIAAANPKYGKYSVNDSFYSQIDLPQPIFSRFDLIYTITNKDLSMDVRMSIADKILYRGSKKQEKELKKLEFTKEFLLKYISYSKQFQPEMTKEASVYIKDRWTKLMNFQNNHNRSDILDLNDRHLTVLSRICKNHARICLRKELTVEDAEFAYETLLYSIRQLGVDPESGSVVESFDIEGLKNKNITTSDLQARIVKIVREYVAQNNKPISDDEIFEILKFDGYDNRSKVEKYIQKLSLNGDIYEPRGDGWDLVRK